MGKRFRASRFLTRSAAERRPEPPPPQVFPFWNPPAPVPTTTIADDNIGAVSEENGTVDQLIRVKPLPPGTKL